MDFKIKISGIDDLDKAASDFLEKVNGYKKFAFFSEMGSGKTTFIKAVCRKLKVVDNVSSPTFSIVNEYLTEGQERILHCDFYRISKLEEVFDLGYEEYFFSDNYIFIEWSENIEEILPADFLKLRILLENDYRLIVPFK